MIELIRKSANGKVFRCDRCNNIHVEYKNLSFNLNEKQYRDFVNKLLELDGKEWEERNKDSYYTRKIIIPTGNKSIRLLLDNQELSELKDLLTNNTDTHPVFTKYFTNKTSFTSFKN